MVICTRRRFIAAALVSAAGAATCQTKRLRPGCQANGWNLDPARFDLLLTALREMKELGFEGFETNIRFLEPQLHRAKEARAEIEAIGVEFIGAHTGLSNYELTGIAAAADKIGKTAEAAKTFGARAVVLSHSGLSKTGEFSEKALEQKVRMLDQAGQRCRDAGVILAYHNHEPEFQKHAAEETGLLRGTDPKLVSLMLDIGHAWLADPDANQFFVEHHTRVFGLHLRDYHNRVSVPLGQGEFPMRQLKGAIEKTGWSGWLIDEEERPNDPVKPGKAATGPSRKTMREVFGV
jgi:sugar phosphate isomerase/epimerase